MAEERPRALGRGLSALMGDKPAEEAGRPRAGRTLPIAFLKPNRFQPRKNFSAEELADLANSIREKGMLLPILARPVLGVPDSYEIVAGERRWRAAQMAKLHEVPVVVREMSDAELLELAIIENVQRSDLNAVEEATAYQELIDRFGYTQERLAQDVGKSRSHIANTLRLLKLPAAVQAMLRDGKLTAGHARTLIGLPNAEELAQEIVAGGLNVRQAERRAPARTGKAKTPHEKNPDVRALETSLTNMLGLIVQVVDKPGKGGELRIAYKTLEQLDDLIRRLNRPG